jgi:hypothetical protein
MAYENKMGYNSKMKGGSGLKWIAECPTPASGGAVVAIIGGTTMPTVRLVQDFYDYRNNCD